MFGLEKKNIFKWAGQFPGILLHFRRKGKCAPGCSRCCGASGVAALSANNRLLKRISLPPSNGNSNHRYQFTSGKHPMRWVGQGDVARLRTSTDLTSMMMSLPPWWWEAEFSRRCCRTVHQLRPSTIDINFDGNNNVDLNVKYFHWYYQCRNDSDRLWRAPRCGNAAISCRGSAEIRKEFRQCWKNQRQESGATAGRPAAPPVATL